MKANPRCTVREADISQRHCRLHHVEWQRDVPQMFQSAQPYTIFRFPPSPTKVHNDKREKNTCGTCLPRHYIFSVPWAPHGEIPHRTGVSKIKGQIEGSSWQQWPAVTSATDKCHISEFFSKTPENYERQMTRYTMTVSFFQLVNWRRNDQNGPNFFPPC